MTEERRWGYVLISRKAFAQDDLWKEPRAFSRWEAWLDIIQMAAWEPRKRIVRDEPVTLERGEFYASIRFLAERWKWSPKRARVFVGTLEKRAQVRAQRRAKHGTIYLVVNYDTYQTPDPQKGKSRGIPRAKQGQNKGTNRNAVKACNANGAVKRPRTSGRVTF